MRPDYVEEEIAKMETKTNKRGSVNNKNRLQAFSNKAAEGHAEWDAAYPERVHGVVCKITALGGAVTFGLSRNQGAYSVTLMLDRQRETMWFNGDADLNEEMEKIIGTLEAMD